MKKLITFITLLFTTFLFVGSFYFPNDTIMWFANTTVHYQILRGILLAALLTVLLSHPPRALYFRWFIGGLSLGLLIVSISSIFTYSMNLLDMLVFIETAIVLGVEALEEEHIRLHSITRKITGKEKPSFS